MAPIGWAAAYDNKRLLVGFDAGGFRELRGNISLLQSLDGVAEEIEARGTGEIEDAVDGAFRQELPDFVGGEQADRQRGQLGAVTLQLVKQRHRSSLREW